MITLMAKGKSRIKTNKAADEGQDPLASDIMEPVETEYTSGSDDPGNQTVAYTLGDLLIQGMSTDDDSPNISDYEEMSSEDENGNGVQNAHKMLSSSDNTTDLSDDDPFLRHANDDHDEWPYGDE